MPQKKRTLVAIVFMLGVLFFTIAGCSNNSKDDPVVINSFTADATDVLAKATVTLSWDVSAAEQLSISPDVGDVTGKNSTTVEPLTDTTYTLTASNSDYSETASVSITVSPAGYVYITNPITATGSADFEDQDDQTNAALDAARSQVALRYLDGSGKLIGTYADLSATGISTNASFGYDAPDDYTPGAVVTTSESYHFSRDTYAFSEVNCYYHLTMVHDLLTSLGFESINNRSVPVHAFYFRGLNAFYSGYDEGLHFGYHYTQGGQYVGPDASEDSEVVVHELGHAVQGDQYSLWGITLAQGAMGEGFGDFLGQVADSRFPYYEGEWFGHLYPSYTTDGIPYLRPLNLNWVYPQDLGMVIIDDPEYGTGIYYEVHYDGMFWSSAMMALRDALVQVHGSETHKALQLILQSHYDHPQNFREAAQALLSANTQLFSGEDNDLITQLLTDRGFFNEPGPPRDYPFTTLNPNVSQQLQTYAPLFHYAQVTIGSGISRLEIRSAVGSENPDADIDLYVRRNGVNPYEYDYAATTPEGDELITIDAPQAGTYGILIQAYSQDGNYGSGMTTYSIEAKTQ